MNPGQNVSLVDVLNLFDGMKSAFTFFLGVMLPRSLDGAMFWGLFYLVVEVSNPISNFKIRTLTIFRLQGNKNRDGRR